MVLDYLRGNKKPFTASNALNMFVLYILDYPTKMDNLIVNKVQKNTK